MPAAGPQNTRKAQKRRKPAPQVPHGPGGTMLRRAPKPAAPAYRPSSGDTKGAGEFRKAESFKRGRQYYSDYNVAFSKNKKVEKATKTLRSEAKKGEFRGGKYKKAMGDLYREQARGPDKVAEGAYRPYTKRLWRLVHEDYPKGKRPGFKVSNASKGQALAWTEGDTVYYSPETLRAFEERDGTEARKFAEGAPLHEWTHARQRKLPKALAEGGAEAHAQDVAKKHKRNYVSNPRYSASTKYARRRKRFVKKTQFK